MRASTRSRCSSRFSRWCGRTCRSWPSAWAHPTWICARKSAGRSAIRAAEQAAGRKPLLLLASSDMNHYESREVGRRKDDLALAAIEAVDPEGLFPTVLAEHHHVRLPSLDRASLRRARAGVRSASVVARRDSGEETGEPSPWSATRGSSSLRHRARQRGRSTRPRESCSRRSGQTRRGLRRRERGPAACGSPSSEGRSRPGSRRRP